MTTYSEAKHNFENDLAVRFKTLDAFKHFDASDPVKALHDIENLRYLIKLKLSEFNWDMTGEGVK